jgi:hypothetical protein
MATHLVSSTPILAETLDPSFSDYPVTANPAVPTSPGVHPGQTHLIRVKP